jgi:anthranilate phosphoribosyltransferase
MQLHQVENIRVNNAEESKVMILAVLAGEPGPARDIVLLNAGAAIYVAGMAGSLQSGVAKAAQVIDDRSASGKLKQLIELSAHP